MKLTLQVEVPGEGATATRNGANEASLALSPSLACLCSSRSSDLLSLNLGPWIAVRTELAILHTAGWQALLIVRWATIRARIRRGAGRRNASWSLGVGASRGQATGMASGTNGRWHVRTHKILRSDWATVAISSVLTVSGLWGEELWWLEGRCRSEIL